MTDFKPINSFESLVTQLEKEKILFHRVENESVVRLFTHSGNQKIVLYIRWEPIPGVIQFIQVLPLVVPKEKRETVAVLLNHINFDLNVLGFALNEKTGVLTYRTQTFLNETRSILPGMIGVFIGFTAGTVEKYFPKFQAAATTKPKINSLFDSY